MSYSVTVTYEDRDVAYGPFKYFFDCFEILNAHIDGLQRLGDRSKLTTFCIRNGFNVTVAGPDLSDDAFCDYQKRMTEDALRTRPAFIKAARTGYLWHLDERSDEQETAISFRHKQRGKAGGLAHSDVTKHQLNTRMESFKRLRQEQRDRLEI